MIRRLLTMVNERWNGMHEAAILLGVFSLVSQLIGLVRDRMLAHVIGPSSTLDIYYAAFRIPDFIYLSVASLASITVLMPFIIERMDANGREAARKFFNDVLSGFLLLLLAVCTVVFIFMPQLAHVIAPGFTAAQMHQLAGASRIMLLSPILLGLSNMIGTITQLMRKFIVFALSPIFYNLGIIFGLFVLYPRFGNYGLAWGVAIGAVMHVLIQVPTLFTSGFRPKLSARLQHSTLKQVVSLSLPRTLGLSMNSIALLVIVALGSTLAPGFISIFNFALDLETTPVGVIGTSYAVAVFPILSEAFARGEKEKWQSSILSATKQIVFWSLPITAIFIVLRAQIVRITLGSGAFSWSDTKLTAACFALFTIGMIAQNMILVSTRSFYAAHNTKTPLSINALCSTGIVILAFLLLHLFKDVPTFRFFIESLLRVDDTPGAAVLMLPLAYSVGTLVNAYLHWYDMRKQYLTSSDGMGRTFLQSFAAAVGGGLATYWCLNISTHFLNLHTTLGILEQTVIALFGGIAIIIAILFALKNEQFLELIVALRRKFWKVDLVTSEEPLAK